MIKAAQILWKMRKDYHVAESQTIPIFEKLRSKLGRTTILGTTEIEFPFLLYPKPMPKPLHEPSAEPIPIKETHEDVVERCTSQIIICNQKHQAL